MKKTLFLAISILFTYMIWGQEIDIQKIDFNGVNLVNYQDKINFSEQNSKYNIVFSSILPAGGIYSIKDNVTGKESIVQIGFSIADQSPYTLYLPEYLFNFFISTYDKKPDMVNLRIKFLGWNKTGAESLALDVQSLLVEPDNSIPEIKKNGKDKFYLQLGSYSFQQNAFPAITELLPYLELRPHFYLIRINLTNDKSAYRILAGPYSQTEAKRITETLNSSKKTSIFIQNYDAIVKDDAGKPDTKQKTDVKPKTEIQPKTDEKTKTGVNKGNK
jgi:hypothetical protein